MSRKSDPEPDIDKLMKEIAGLRQANNNILQFSLGIIETLENHGKQLVASGNALFILSNRLREIIQKSSQLRTDTSKDV